MAEMIKEWNCIPREKIRWNPTVDEAISFPPLSMLTDLRQVWARANPCKCQKQ